MKIVNYESYMELFSIDFKKITEQDLRELESNPANFENYEIEYKFKYDGNADELRRDIVQFANGNSIGYLFYGWSNNPIKIVGIDKNEVDHLKNVLNNALKHNIEPQLFPFPKFHPVSLSNGKYVLLVKIVPKVHGIYGIRLSDNPSNENFNIFEFYQRMDGTKHKMNVEDIVDLIESKMSGQKQLFRKEDFSEKIKEIESEVIESQNEAINFVSLKEGDPGYVLFGISIIPFNNNLTILDLKSEEIDDFIKNLENNFLYRNPYGGMTEFSNFLRNFEYNREFYESELIINTNYGYNHSIIDIAGNGRINHLIIYDAPLVMDINPREFYYGEESKREEFHNSLLLSSVLPPYLFLMWFKLAKLIFEIGKFKGEFSLLIRIMTNRSLALWYEYKELGQNDIIIKEVLNTNDLSNKENLRKVLDNLLMELLRYFKYDLKDKEKGISIFNDTIRDYIDFVFK